MEEYAPPLSHLADDPMTRPQLRASYRIVDHRERQIAPHSLAFNLHANRCVDPAAPRT